MSISASRSLRTSVCRLAAAGLAGPAAPAAAASAVRATQLHLASAAPLSFRCLSSTSKLAAAPVKPPSKSDRSTPPDGPLRDEHIAEESDYVRLVDPKTGSLAGPFNTRAILAKLDRTKFWIQQVAPPQPSRATISYDPSSPAGSIDVSALVQFPICKLIDKKEEFDKQRALKRKQSAAPPTSGSTSKEVQLTWSVSPNDLSHKLGKARKEMLKGARINVVVTTKSGGRKYIKGLDPKEDQRREELLQKIEEFLCTNVGADAGETTAVGEAPIARRLQDVEWQRGGSAAVMSFECFRK